MLSAFLILCTAAAFGALAGLLMVTYYALRFRIQERREAKRQALLHRHTSYGRPAGRPKIKAKDTKKPW